MAKIGPFSLVFCQIVALMLPRRSGEDGRLDEVLVTLIAADLSLSFDS